MRIITGTAKGTVLKTLAGDATRPTAERVKEAVFSMLQFNIEDRAVLDLFSGSGQMGLEALSRGASSAILVDKSRDAVKIIEDNAKKTRLFEKCTIVQSDYLDFIKRNAGKRFDIIILDPPYAKGFYVPALKAMLSYDMIKRSSIIVCESGAEEIFGDDVDLKSKLTIVKQTKYASTYITLLSLAEEDEND